MDAEATAVVVDLVHIESVEAVESEAWPLEAPLPEAIADEPGRERSEASSASRTAAVVAPSPPDPDYFVG